MQEDEQTAMRAFCASRSHSRNLRWAVVAVIGLSLSAAVTTMLADTIDSEPITPVPAVEALDPGKVGLGQKMFHDPRLSRGDRVACASCHDLDRGGDDGRARSVAADGRPLDFNASTVFNGEPLLPPKT